MYAWSSQEGNLQQIMSLVSLPAHMLFTQYVSHIINNSVSQYLLVGGVHLFFTYYSNRTKSLEKAVFPTNKKALL